MARSRVCPYCEQPYEVEYGVHITAGHPISCDDTKAKFPEYTYGKLDEETDEKVIIHLSVCRPCYDALLAFISERRESRKITEREEGGY